MKIVTNGLILALISSTALLDACSGTGTNTNSANAKAATAANSANDNTNAARTNVEELGVLVNVPYVTEDIVWKEDAAHKKLIAVLRFSTADSNKLVAEAEKIRPPEKVTISTETWFPDELNAQSEMNSDHNLPGLAYAADQFYQAPYTDGRITRIEGTDYFVLEVFAK